MDERDIDAILTAYRTGKDPDGESGVQVGLVRHAELKGNEWDLNIGRYLKTALVDTLDVTTALVNLASAQDDLRKAEEHLAARLKGAGYA